MLIAVDLDYTLLDSNGNISDDTIAVFKKCKEKGHKIVINSARSLIRSKASAEAIGADYINCFYGNLIVDRDGHEIYSRNVDIRSLRSIVKDFSQIFKGWSGIEAKDGGFSNDQITKKLFNATIISKKELLNKKAYKIIFEIDKAHHEQAKEIADKYDFDITFGREGYFCSFIPKNSNKWYGLEKILEYEGKPKSELMSFGDDVSDLMTFDNSGVGVAMSNATRPVLDKISERTQYDNDNDGVARYLESQLLQS